jgi:hypothetical protein
MWEIHVRLKSDVKDNSVIFVLTDFQDSLSDFLF